MYKTAQSLIDDERKVGMLITPDLIVEKVNLAANYYPRRTFTFEQKEEAREKLSKEFSVWIGKDISLVNNVGHEDSWLMKEGRKKDWLYWLRYEDWLKTKISPIAVDGIGESTDKILGFLEDPRRKGDWDRRGLVVGHVQSGKTSNYAGLICKAADAGYKIIIVLAGLHNNLRAQTQIRLEEAFLGYKTPMGEGQTGVDEHGVDGLIRPNCITTRLDSGDFNTAAGRTFNIGAEQMPWLFVVKKNTMVLKQLLKWITNQHDRLPNLPLLLIDDEADHASVDTGERLFEDDGNLNKDYQPTAINRGIRKILHAFPKSAYVGYTATPFANIFIYDDSASTPTTDLGPDLFPTSFIINLAAPSNYIGPARIFGLSLTGDTSEGLPLIRDVADHVNVEGDGGWMPPKHRTVHIPGVAPPSLEEAVHAFVLTCAARVVRGQGAEHCSMLVHVTRFTAVQEKVHKQVADIVQDMANRIRRGVNDKKILAELEKLWLRDFEPTCSKIAQSLPAEDEDKYIAVPSWAKINKELGNVLGDIEVKIINGTAGDVLNYATPGKGLKVIAIGGDKLARGLTLEGLCVSYFVRTSKMYDTLMQMGRWFGYRQGYLDLCRLYMTKELVDWFKHIANASEELRDEFEAMVESKKTPSQYGLKVRSHPVLTVTSPLKMRTAKTLQLSFSGTFLETTSFYRDLGNIQKNLNTTNDLIKAMIEAVKRKEVDYEANPTQVRNKSTLKWEGAHLWTGVSGEEVGKFLASYKTHEKTRKVNSALLSTFVRKMMQVEELTSWTVLLLGSGDGKVSSSGEGKAHAFAGGLKIKSMPTRIPSTEITDRYSIGRLLSPRDESIDLDDIQWKKAFEMTTKTWTPDPARQKDSAPPKEPRGSYIRQVRAKKQGLLLLYPLDPVTAGINVAIPIMAFGVSFPKSDSGTLIDYAVNYKFYESEYGPAD